MKLQDIENNYEEDRAEKITRIVDELDFVIWMPTFGFEISLLDDNGNKWIFQPDSDTRLFGPGRVYLEAAELEMIEEGEDVSQNGEYVSSPEAGRRLLIEQGYLTDETVDWKIHDYDFLNWRHC